MFNSRYLARIFLLTASHKSVVSMRTYIVWSLRRNTMFMSRLEKRRVRKRRDGGDRIIDPRSLTRKQAGYFLLAVACIVILAVLEEIF